MEHTSAKSIGRKPWVAALMSILKPGLGQVYNGELKKGLAFFPVFLIGLPLMTAIVLHVPASAFLATILVMALLMLSVFALSAVDAWRNASKHRESFHLKKYNRWYVYAVFYILGIFLDTSIKDISRSRWLEPYVSPTESMAPTILAGDRFYVDKRFKPSDNSSGLIRGQIVVYQQEGAPTYVKRVVGLPGDKIEIIDKEVVVNGEPLPKRPAEYDHKTLPSSLGEQSVFEETSAIGNYYLLYDNGKKRDPFSVTVPQGQLFVLGDYRDNSFDSRSPGHGAIPIGSVIGKPLQIWFSWDPHAKSIRWSRMGRTIQ